MKSALVPFSLAMSEAGIYGGPVATDLDACATAMTDSLQYMFDATPIGWLQREVGVIAGATGIPIPMFNGIWAESRHPDAATVAGLLARLDATGLPYCMQVRPGTPPDITDQALQRGMRREGDVPLMILETPSALKSARRVNTLAIHVLTPGEVGLHVSVAAEDCGMPEELLSQLMSPDLLRAKGVHCYVGEWEGKAVTTGLGITVGHFAGIFNIATPAAFRAAATGLLSRRGSLPMRSLREQTARDCSRVRLVTTSTSASAFGPSSAGSAGYRRPKRTQPRAGERGAVGKEAVTRFGGRLAHGASTSSPRCSITLAKTWERVLSSTGVSTSMKC